MKIAVIQLARLGDIYLTWPACRALNRKYPEAELHLIVRSRFRAAAEGLAVIKRVWSMDTVFLLDPLLDQSPDAAESSERVAQWSAHLREENFDRIFNLSFSPFSSYLTAQLAHSHTAVRGYSRYPDDTLCLPDDVSSYFYAQVGIGRCNRIHLAELFARTCGVTLRDEDWACVHPVDQKEPYVVLHVGASQSQKCYGPSQWREVINQVGEHWHGKFVLIGARNERESTEAHFKGDDRLVNRVGQTELPELFPLIAGAQGFIGADSGPLHIASLTGTPTLNVSFAHVNFWETGPLAPRSRVVWALTPEDLAPSQVAAELMKLLTGEPAAVPGLGDEFGWRMVQAIYFGGAIPQFEKSLERDGLVQLKEVNSVALQQLRSFFSCKDHRTSAKILERVDDVIQTIVKLVPSLRPLIAWYEAEKIRVGPGSLERIVSLSLAAHERFEVLLKRFLEGGEYGVHRVAEG